ncbi:hypothetical protein Tco_0872668 [Tanacetum coccineum]
MSAFPRLDELAVAANSSFYTQVSSKNDSIKIVRAEEDIAKHIINDVLQFVARSSHLWEVLYSRVHEHRLLITELNVFGGPLALQCAEFLKQFS